MRVDFLRRHSILFSLISASTISSFVCALGTPLSHVFYLIDLLSMMVVFIVPCLLVGFFLGLPIFFVFQKLKLIGFWSTLFSGVVLGALVAFGVAPASFSAKAVLPFLVNGVVSSFVFWGVWRFLQEAND
jgi:hypothetical protein